MFDCFTFFTAFAPAARNAVEVVLLPENVDEHFLLKAQVD